MRILKRLLDYSQILLRVDDADLEVGGIELGPRDTDFPVPDGWPRIGRDECDPISIDPETDEVVILDHEMTGRVMSRIALNLPAFLSALVVLEDYYEKCEGNEGLFENRGLAEATARMAIERAGGTKYDGFYSSVLGIE